MKVVYHRPEDATEFDIERYYKSLNRYGKVSREDIEKAVKGIRYDPVHSSVLVELGIQLLPTDATAKDYWTEHQSSGEVSFERLRRITGYLVGSLERWNDFKRAEEAARVKHNVPLNNSTGTYTTKQKALREEAKKDDYLGQQDEYRKGTCYD